MSRPKSVGELTELLEQAKRRKTEREKRKLESTRTPQKAEERTIVYYRDPIILGRIFEIAVPKSNLEKFGGGTLAAGITAAGLTLDAPTGEGAATPIQVLKGSKFAIVRLEWYFGDNLPVREKTPWGTVWTRNYDKDGGKSHYQIPFSIVTGAFNLSTVITKFTEMFDSDAEKNKRSLIGVLGQAKLTVGYGNQKTILTRSNS
jgi:hypothetical protein